MYNQSPPHIHTNVHTYFHTHAHTLTRSHVLSLVSIQFENYPMLMIVHLLAVPALFPTEIRNHTLALHTRCRCQLPDNNLACFWGFLRIHVEHRPIGHMYATLLRATKQSKASDRNSARQRN